MIARVSCHRVAAYARSRSRCTGRTCRSPRSVLRNTGTNTASDAMRMRATSDVLPNIV